MAKAYLFGAGASHSYKLSPHSIPPPLASNFFSTVYELELAKDLHVLMGNFIRYVTVTREINEIEVGAWEENVEKFLTEIDAALSNEAVQPEFDVEKWFLYSRAYDEMIFLFTYTLNVIQSGPPCHNYSRFLSKIESEDNLITFNWDSLLDRCLWETGLWHPYDGYGISFNSYFDDGWYEKIQGKPSERKLLKLHGSTNWLMPFYTFSYKDKKRVFVNNSINPDEKPMYCFLRATREYPTFKDRCRVGFKPFSYYYYPPNIPVTKHTEKSGVQDVRYGFDPKKMWEEGKVTWEVARGRQDTASMPLIIPPVERKDYGLLGNALDPVWQQAKDSIATSSELYVIGYSFPETDTEAINMLREAVKKRNKPLDIIVVNPQPDDIVRKIRNAVGDQCQIKSKAQTFGDYVDKLCEE